MGTKLVYSTTSTRIGNMRIRYSALVQNVVRIIQVGITRLWQTLVRRMYRRSAECGEDGCNTKQTKLCEVGDLSGKDGPAEPKQKGRKLKFKGKFTKDKSLTEEVLEDFIGRSVVFHCASGARIFCAPI